MTRTFKRIKCCGWMNSAIGAVIVDTTAIIAADKNCRSASMERLEPVGVVV